MTFFAYPNKPTTPVPPGVDIHVLARTDQDADEAVTFGRGFFPFARAAEPHDWLNSTGGAIGCLFARANARNGPFLIELQI